MKKHKFLNIIWDSQVYSPLNRIWNLSKLKLHVRETLLRFSRCHVNQVQKITKVINTCSSNSREILMWIRFKILKMKEHKILNVTWDSLVYSYLKRVWNFSIVKKILWNSLEILRCILIWIVYGIYQKYNYVKLTWDSLILMLIESRSSKK